jgi:hypothetical protein
MSHEASDQKSIPLDRDIFFRSLIRELAGVLEEIVGIKDASGFKAYRAVDPRLIRGVNGSCLRADSVKALAKGGFTR